MKHFLKIPTETDAIKTTRLIVTAQFDRYIGWANFDPEKHCHTKGNKDSTYFCTIFQKDWGHGELIVLSVQVLKTPFLVNDKNSDDTYIVEGVQKLLDHKKILKF